LDYQPGMSRTVDVLGRIVLPAEIRRTLGLGAGSAMQISMQGRHIVLVRSEASCFNCGSEAGLSPILNRRICAECAEELWLTGLHTTTEQ
jgi:transcriptional pleiotropic regulator of transition state genes